MRNCDYWILCRNPAEESLSFSTVHSASSGGKFRAVKFLGGQTGYSGGWLFAGVHSIQIFVEISKCECLPKSPHVTLLWLLGSVAVQPHGAKGARYLKIIKPVLGDF